MHTLHTLSRDGYRPGLIGRCATLMSRFYCDKFGFGAGFETATARGLADFVDRFDAARDALWWLERDGEVVGCAAVDGQQPGPAQFRWFYLSAALRGRGLGRQVLRQAITFAQQAGHATLRLQTHADLQAAVALYERHGFVLLGQRQGLHWGRPLCLRDYAKALPAPANAPQALSVAPPLAPAGAA